MRGHAEGDRLVRAAGEGDEGGVEGAGDVFEEDFHGGDVGCVGFLRPRQDVAADAAGGFFKNPCAGVAGDYIGGLD